MPAPVGVPPLQLSLNYMQISLRQVEYSDEPGRLYYFKYPLADDPEGGYLPIATTRPETILGDTAVAVHPEDERFKHLVGRECEVPMCDGRCAHRCSPDGL